MIAGALLLAYVIGGIIAACWMAENCDDSDEAVHLGAIVTGFVLWPLLFGSMAIGKMLGTWDKPKGPTP